jgi:hypothetical protein
MRSIFGPGERSQFRIIDWFKEETKVLELGLVHIVIKWDTCSITVHLLMID